MLQRRRVGSQSWRDRGYARGAMWLVVRMIRLMSCVIATRRQQSTLSGGAAVRATWLKAGERLRRHGYEQFMAQTFNNVDFQRAFCFSKADCLFAF